jgi:hypothetical protein
MKPAQRRWSEALELLGQTTDTEQTNWNSSFLAGPTNATIPANQTQTVITPIFAGLFATHYLLPGRFPLTIELELVVGEPVLRREDHRRRERQPELLDAERPHPVRRGHVRRRRERGALEGPAGRRRAAHAPQLLLDDDAQPDPEPAAVGSNMPRAPRARAGP